MNTSTATVAAIGEPCTVERAQARTIETRWPIGVGHVEVVVRTEHEPGAGAYRTTVTWQHATQRTNGAATSRNNLALVFRTRIDEFDLDTLRETHQNTLASPYGQPDCPVFVEALTEAARQA